MKRIRKALAVAQAVGWENLPRRVMHTLGMKSGWMRYRLPGGELAPEQMLRNFRAGYSTQRIRDDWQQRATRFFAQSPAALQPALRRIVTDDQWLRDVAAVTAELDQGIVELFSQRKVKVDLPIDFNRDPIHNLPWPVGRHWSDYRTFDPTLADIKCVWELSRFSAAYKLARDYARNDNRQAAQAFAALVLHWRATNPYGLSPQWICSQEATFRIMALLFAACVMLPHIADDRVLQAISELVWYTGRQLERKIAFARSQKNNHAISEAVGLWTIGTLFPELNSAPRWQRAGHEILKQELLRQIYRDGSYVQHSMSYHRVMLDDVLWTIALARSADQPLDPAIIDQTRRATDWLVQMIDPSTGRAPNYGSNDGANVLPLSCSDYLDYRPVAQAAHVAVYGTRCYGPGPWDEKPLWLFGARALEGDCQPAAQPAIWSAPAGGYYIIRGPHTRAMCRIHSYIDRPGQADLLHLDLWFQSQNILRDAGSYHYNAPGGWAEYFKSTASHNTVQVDRCDQMEKGPRFLWLHWAKAKLNAFRQSDDQRVAYLEGEHYGYRRLADSVTHRRAVLKIDDAYLVVDDLLGQAPHELALRWRLAPCDWTQHNDSWTAQVDGRPLQVRVVAPSGIAPRLVCGQTEPTIEGWESLYYSLKEAVPTLIASGHATLPARFVTLVKPAEMSLDIHAAGTWLSDVASPVSLRGVPPELTGILAGLTGGRVVPECP